MLYGECVPFVCYGHHNLPDELTIRAVIANFATSLLDIELLSCIRTVRTEENVAAVVSTVDEDREMSIRSRSQ